MSVFGAAYHPTGDRHFIDVADHFAAIGVEAMSVSDPKHSNQAMRGFARYLGYRDATRRCRTAANRRDRVSSHTAGVTRQRAVDVRAAPTS